MNRIVQMCATAGVLAVLATPARSQDKGVAHGLAVYQAQCALCHGAGREGGLGPSLQGIDQRPIAGASFGYTPALRALKGTWDRVRLDAFLSDPQAVAPGSSMAVRVGDAAERRDLVAFLLTQSTAAAASPVDAGAAPGRFGDWRNDAPGRRYRITAADLPEPYATRSASNSSQVVARPPGALPKVPAGFTVAVFASDLNAPRQLRTAPNGDVFVTETSSGRVRVLRATADGSRAERTEVFASGLSLPFGLAFYPVGPNPQWLYVAETNRIVRFRYSSGSLKAEGPPEVVLNRISPSSGGHSNRDLAVSNDGQWMYVGVGSASNVADAMSTKPVAEAQQIGRSRGLGAAWDGEEGRAQVLAFKPDGSAAQAFATGIRNCSGIAVQPATDTVWCSTNERDALGDDLVPDYVTRVKKGAFYGWPWWYIGDHEDPRRKGERPDLRGQVSVPDVLLQPHSASLGITFAPGARLPDAWKGSAFAAEHGSWNRANRTGSKLIRIPVNPDGSPSGGYEDVMTGFVLDDTRVWGRIVGVTAARDGALLVTDDAGGVVWQLVYTGP
ncbi:sorbosone dehydrogenase family protein [soil metagenome]